MLPRSPETKKKLFEQHYVCPKYSFANAISYNSNNLSASGSGTPFDALGNCNAQEHVFAVGKKDFFRAHFIKD